VCKCVSECVCVSNYSCVRDGKIWTWKSIHLRTFDHYTYSRTHTHTLTHTHILTHTHTHTHAHTHTSSGATMLWKRWLDKDHVPPLQCTLSFVPQLRVCSNMVQLSWIRHCGWSRRTTLRIPRFQTCACVCVGVSMCFECIVPITQTLPSNTHTCCAHLCAQTVPELVAKLPVWQKMHNVRFAQP
jgi:hypothetical protein